MTHVTAYCNKHDGKAGGLKLCINLICLQKFKSQYSCHLEYHSYILCVCHMLNK
jgi:hypothetical protein